MGGATMSRIKTHEISQARNPDLRTAMMAMQRAAELARQIAIQTNTAIIVVREGQLIRITAEQLRQERNAKGPSNP
jgi:hypothetical protein